MLQRSDLWSLEQYSEERAAFRSTVLAHKQHRRVLLGDHIMLVFEDETTIKYQIQEMLRIEKVFEADGIQEELDAYNPLIPDGDNWKCSMLIQYEEVDVRKERLSELVGIEDKVWVQIGDEEKVFPIADEDLDRSTDEKTSAVHFLRYQLNPAQIAAAKSGGAIVFGIDHPNYPLTPLTVPAETREALTSDLD